MNHNQPQNSMANRCIHCCAFLIAFNVFLIGSVAYIAGPKVSAQLTTVIHQACEQAKVDIIIGEITARGECRKAVFGAQGYKNAQDSIQRAGETGFWILMIAGSLSGLFGYFALRRKPKSK